MFEGELEVVTATIKKPHINDLVIFPYKPHNMEDIFRVKDINTVLFSWESEVYFHKLSLEYANMSKNSLQGILKGVVKSFVYLMDKEIYIRSEDYRELLLLLKNIEELLKNNLSWDEVKEIYKELSPEQNNILLKFLDEFKYYFPSINIPFGDGGLSSCLPPSNLENINNLMESMVKVKSIIPAKIKQTSSNQC